MVYMAYVCEQVLLVHKMCCSISECERVCVHVRLIWPRIYTSMIHISKIDVFAGIHNITLIRPGAAAAAAALH